VTTSATTARVRAVVTLAAGAGLVTLRYQPPGGHVVTDSASLGPGVVPLPVTFDLKGLLHGRVYRYAFNVSTADGTAASGWRTFRAVAQKR
jgi:hypothetical protein